MLIKELFEESTKNNYIDLQALIMFLVFEKQVLGMEEDSSSLDKYFLDKHSQKMNKELMSYKQKMKIGYGPQVYELQHNDKKFYILSYSQKQAELIANQNLIKTELIRLCDLNELMSYDGKEMTLKTLIEGKGPGVLGGL